MIELIPDRDRPSRARMNLLRRTSVALLATWVLAGCSGQTTESPDILVVTIDTLRPDALGWHDGRNATPTLDAIAGEGLVFRNGVTSVPITLPAHAAIMTGCYPFRLGINDNGQSLAPGSATLAAALQARGYLTAAFVSGFPLKRMFGLDQGFDRYDDEMPAGKEGFVERRAQDTTAAAIAWLTAQDRDAPMLVWVHYYDPHAPYEPPREFWQPGARGSYDGEVAYTDYWIGELLAGWNAARARARVTVVTSDHGEALGEHGEDTHGFFVYDSTILAPVIWHWPGRIAARRDDAQVRHIDIAPTLAKIAGVAAPNAGCEGRALDAVLEGGAAEARSAHIETYLPWNYFGWSPLTALREPPLKYIDAPVPELFDLEADPGEAENLHASAATRGDRLVVALDAIRAAPVLQAAAAPAQDIVSQLRGLGYIGMGQGAASLPANLADPKERIELRRQLMAADAALSAGRLEPGLAVLDAALATEPGSRFAALRAGTHLLQVGQVERALPYLQTAVANDHERAEARFALGDALMRSGRFDEALQQWLELARLQPRRFEAWFNIAICHRRLGREAQAQSALQRAREIDPDNRALATFETDGAN
jgi:choline-sulfatase